MKIVITGVAGFVGSNLARRCLADGHTVVGVDCLTPYYDVEIKRRNLASIPVDGFTLVERDLLDLDTDDLLSEADVVFHEAGQPGVRSSWGSEFSNYVDANIVVTQRLLESAVKSKTVTRFVYASSSSVYGDAETFPTRETDPTNPLSPYGVTKLAGEHLCALYAASFGLHTVSLRYFTVYGPGQRPDMAFARFCTAALDGTPITLYGTGEQVRDFTHVDDVVEANMLAVTAEVSPGIVMNVAGGTNVSVNDVLGIIQAVSGRELVIDRQPAALGDVLRTGGSTDRIRRELGWVPRVSLDVGLRQQFDWLRSSRSVLADSSLSLAVSP